MVIIASGFHGDVQAFDLSQVVHARVAGMKAPKMRPGTVGVQMTISSPSQKVREHVRQGFALVHAQWDFEAYRHFCAALAEDPDCLMAYCGVTLALVQPFSEFADQRRAAVTRMLDMIDADNKAVVEGKGERFSALEKRADSHLLGAGHELQPLGAGDDEQLCAGDAHCFQVVVLYININLR